MGISWQEKAAWIAFLEPSEGYLSLVSQCLMAFTFRAGGNAAITISMYLVPTVPSRRSKRTGKKKGVFFLFLFNHPKLL